MLTRYRCCRGAVPAVALGLLLFAGGCGSQTYVSGYSFYPQPAVVEVRQRGNSGQVPMTVLASVLGIRNPDSQRHTPYAVAIRLRLENNGPAQTLFDPGTLELVTGTLRPFPRPQVDPPTTLVLSAGQRQEVTAYFPLPPGTSPDQMNLSNLRLRWQMRVDNYSVPQTALFQRVAGPDPNYYSDTAPPPPPDATY